MENPNKTLFECQQMFRHACAFSDCADFANEKFCLHVCLPTEL